MADQYALYRIALEGAWIQSSLNRKALSLRKIVAPIGFRASRARVELATCGFQSTTTARYLAPHRRGGEKVVQRARLLRPCWYSTGRLAGVGYLISVHRY
jgi:hypothetical protein